MDPLQPRASPDHRNQLATDCSVFAAERTYAAWVHTGLAALASGVGAEALLAEVVPGWTVRLGRHRSAPV